MNKLTAVIGNYDTFLQEIIGRTETADFDMSDFVQCDHMGYRATSLEQFEEKKKQLAACGEQIGQILVNDRPIAIFRLNQPVTSGKWRVDLVELIAPKADSPMPEGLDHVEFVLFDDIKNFLKKYESKKFNLDSADRGINPEVAFGLGDGMKVKFHLLSLSAVVYLEKKLGITEVK